MGETIVVHCDSVAAAGCDNPGLVEWMPRRPDFFDFIALLYARLFPCDAIFPRACMRCFTLPSRLHLQSLQEYKTMAENN
jgi:hypothetical protein